MKQFTIYSLLLALQISSYLWGSSTSKWLISEGFDFYYHFEENRYTYIYKNLKVEFVPYNHYFTIQDQVYRLQKIPIFLKGELTLFSKDNEFTKKILLNYKKKEDQQDQSPPSILNIDSLIDISIPQFLEERKKDKQIDIIFIDAGHGGNDPGAVSYGFQEKDLTLRFSKELGIELKRRYPQKKIIFTRKDDQFLSLKKRSEYANKTLQLGMNAIFISVHFNMWFDANARGFEVYYLSHQSESEDARIHALVKKENFQMSKNNLDDLDDLEKIFGRLEVVQYQKESRQISEFILNNVQNKIKEYPIIRGIKSDLFYVLKGTLMPSILLEVGFMSNREDMEYINDPTKRSLLVQSIAQGINQYIQQFDQTKGLKKR